MSFKTRPLPLVESYFGPSPTPATIAQTFTPGRGWRQAPWRKTVSASWLRKLRAEGVTAVALEVEYRAGERRVADFRVDELLASARQAAASRKAARAARAAAASTAERCRYFAACDRDADGVLPNPALGPVPCCARCAAVVGLELEAAR